MKSHRRPLTPLPTIFALLVMTILIQPVEAQQRPAGTPPEELKGGEFVWPPKVSSKGPIIVVVSLSEQLAYVYRNGVLFAYWPVAARMAPRSPLHHSRVPRLVSMC